jgi:uncharacterized protein YhjY with autotransporter beta-barrel domain
MWALQRVHPHWTYVFIDGSAGHQQITLRTKRALPASQTISQGERTGEQTFSSGTGGSRWKRKVWEIAAYARMDVAQARLGGYSEDGDPSQALRYGDESIATRTRTFGLRGKFKHKTRWGMLEPRMRVEFCTISILRAALRCNTWTSRTARSTSSLPRMTAVIAVSSNWVSSSTPGC